VVSPTEIGFFQPPAQVDEAGARCMNVMLSTSEDLLMGYFDDVVLAIDLSISFLTKEIFLQM